MQAIQAILDFLLSGVVLIARALAALFEFVISFPGQLSALLALAASMPSWIWIPLMTGSTALVIVMIVRAKQVIV
jgi:hypothetical protein